MAYKSCEDCMHTLCFMPEGLRHCMYMIPENAPPVIPVFSNRPIDPEYVFDCKLEIEEMRMDGYVQSDCENCFRIDVKDFDNEKYINKVLISHKTDCNAKCTFCYNNFAGNNRHNPYKIIPQLEQFKPYFKDCEMHFGGGEPTIWEEFDEIIDFAIKENFKKIILATNGSVFSEKLAEAIKNGIAEPVFTTDTADAELFKTIKGLNFEEVTENIKKYLTYDEEKAAIHNKYIIIPNVNDNENAIRQWVDYNEQLGIRNLAVDIEAIFFNENRGNIDEKYKNLVLFAENIILEKGIKCDLYSFASQMKYDDNK